MTNNQIKKNIIKNETTIEDKLKRLLEEAKELTLKDGNSYNISVDVINGELKKIYFRTVNSNK